MTWQIFALVWATVFLFMLPRCWVSYDWYNRSGPKKFEPTAFWWTLFWPITFSVLIISASIFGAWLLWLDWRFFVNYRHGQQDWT